MPELDSYFRYLKSPTNEQFKDIKLHLDGGTKANKLRTESGLTCIEGIHLLKSWVDSPRVKDIHCVITSITDLQNTEIQEILHQLIEYCEMNNHPFPDFVVIDDTLAKTLSSLTNGPFIVAKIQIPNEFFSYQNSENILILDAIQDSGNVGTILRTALAAGYRKVVCTQGTANVWSIKVLRAAMGAHIYLDIVESVNPEELSQQLEQPMYVTALDRDAINLYNLEQNLCIPHAFVFGNEGKGVNELFLNAGIKIFIPQDDHIESLNVSAAAAICLFEARRVNQKSQ